MEKECSICGNDNPDELELVPVYSDGDGKDVKYSIYLCKEGKGCCGGF